MDKQPVMSKNKIKMLLDIVMTVMLLFLMAYQVIGDKYHEWIGAGMLVLFLLHNGLNLGWYRGLFRGKYTPQRVIHTIVNLAVLVAILVTGYSGIVMSRHVFAFLSIEAGMATARQLHLAGSYWAFVLMSFHLGMHWSMILGKMGTKKSAPLFDGMKKYDKWLLRFIATVAAIYGAILFGRAGIYSNMFFQTEFAILDYETLGILIILQNLVMMATWIYVAHYLMKGMNRCVSGKKNKRLRIQGVICLVAAIAVVICSLFSTDWSANAVGTSWQGSSTETTTNTGKSVPSAIAGFIQIAGGTYEMGSPETENWRSPDEVQHTVNVGDFYMSMYELAQAEYTAVMGDNPSNFTGEDLPVENISWLDAVTYCNARSELEGLAPAYIIEEGTVIWDRSADGYRLPTEVEWEYACRAGTTTPFNTETSISPEESNYYGHYPYDIEENYFEQDNLTTQTGEYRETTVAVDSFEPNAWGLYNMHGNVSEWVWDYYGEYDTENATDPTGPATGTLRVYRGGGWNDFAKNIRSAYRATLEEDMGSYNLVIRLVRNASDVNKDIIGATTDETLDREVDSNTENVLIAYFSWGGNTKGVAEEIQKQTGVDIFEITLTDPYSQDYNTVLDQAQHDQNIQARPEIAEHIDNMDEYDTILLGYPNWWASIPMPIASFLEEYDFAEKTIVPFCSHGGGRFGQSRSSIEMNDLTIRPAMIENPLDISAYDEILVGFPVWWGIAPTIINTFMEAHDLTGKTVRVFATSGGSEIGNCERSLQKQYPKIHWEAGKLLNSVGMAETFASSIQ